MENSRIYRLEEAESLFADLWDVYRQSEDCRMAYRLLNRFFLRFLGERTGFSGIRFSGPFAQTDYLLKEYHATRQLKHQVNDARVRLRKRESLMDSVLKECFPFDFKAICQFVALVCRVTVPPDMAACFPASRTVTHGTLKTECLRIIVNRWDDTFLYASADAENTDEVRVFYGGKNALMVYRDWDWSYLRLMLTVGCQLNVVRPREQDGVLYPELFIWEPDYLVDISAVAACFEEYAATPLNHLLDKLKPISTTQPLLLGHLASQFLDESLHDACPTERPYNLSVQRFFRENALSLLTADLTPDFHEQAMSQRRNIYETMQTKLPTMLRSDNIRFDASEIMVEPSFFSEMLGLQGRMDFLQLGHRILLEQKSGRGAYSPKFPGLLTYQKKHYVQLLLYMLLIRYNYRAGYERNNRELHAFLFYSKYADGLLPLGFAPDLMFEALRVRNGIVAREFSYSRGGMAILTGLTADRLNMNHAAGPLWERYQKPQIENLLSPIRQASELELAYYLRFLSFLETEHLLAKVGNQTKENAGFADKWQSSLEDKLLAGNIYCNLELLSPCQIDTGRVEQVVLGFSEKTAFGVSNFRVGDIVILYPYTDGTEPDVRQTMVFRSTIAELTTDRICLSLRTAQVNAKAFWYGGQRKWAVEHDFYEASFGALYRGMHAFLSAPKERRDLILLQRAPQRDRTKKLCADYGDFNEMALRVGQAKDLFLIIGPPGTGKTSYGLLYTLKEALLSSDESVLLLSYTNRAVDEICGKLVACGLDFMRIGGRHTCEDAYRPYLFEERMGQCAKLDDVKRCVAQTRVFVGTTTAFSAHLNIFQLKQFGLAIIDEASQILEPHLMGLLSATGPDGKCAIRKFVLIGDHKQLPAVVQQSEKESAVNEPLLRAIHLTDCRQSLFERLLRSHGNNPEVTYMLTRQGRMHHDIARFPNETFYQGRLEEVPLPHQKASLAEKGRGRNGIEDLLLTRRVAFVAVPSTEQRLSDKVNKNEALAIAATARWIYELHRKNFSPLQTVGVIVPYRNQIAEVRNCLAAYGIPCLNEITIDTVERFQGSQRDYILYGFTIQKYYQLAFLTNNVFEEDGHLIDRKLNVAMTRAREHLVLFGNLDLLENNSVFSRLLTFAKECQGLVTVPLDDFLCGRFCCPPVAERST